MRKGKLQPELTDLLPAVELSINQSINQYLRGIIFKYVSIRPTKQTNKIVPNLEEQTACRDRATDMKGQTKETRNLPMTQAGERTKRRKRIPFDHEGRLMREKETKKERKAGTKDGWLCQLQGGNLL